MIVIPFPCVKFFIWVSFFATFGYSDGKRKHIKNQSTTTHKNRKQLLELVQQFVIFSTAGLSVRQLPIVFVF